MARYQTRQVLGGAYRGRDLSERALYTHLVEVDEDGSEVKTCSGVRIENIGDSYGETPESLKAAPSCPVCARKHARLLSRGELTWAPHPGEEALKPNRALGRAKLETIAWQRTPEDLRGGSGSRREVVMAVPGEGTWLVALSSLTDNELRRYIGHHALVEAGDMQKNGPATAAAKDLVAGDYVCLYGGRRRRVERVRRSGGKMEIVVTGLGTWHLPLNEQVDLGYETTDVGSGAAGAATAGGSVHRTRGTANHWDPESRYYSDMQKNGARTEADETAARELSLYIENDYALVGAPNSIGKSIEHSLTRKLKNGSFNLELSEIAWMHLMEAGAKKYDKEFGDGTAASWSRMFNKATRELVAHEFAVTFYAENKGR